MLQLSTVELNQEIERLVQENPLLELDDSIGSDAVEYRATLPDSPSEPLSADLLDISGENDAKPPATRLLGQKKWPEEADWFEDDGAFRNTRDDDDERDFPQQAAEPPSLRSISTPNSALVRSMSATEES